MAGAPVDIAARQSGLSAIAEATPLIMFQSLVNLGNGRVIGRNLAKFWGNDTEASDIRESLQTLQPIGSPEFAQLEAIFKNWNSSTIDVPGTYYLEVVEKLYKRNELASGSFVALGQKIDLSRLQLPMYLLKERKQFCGFSARARLHTAWVILRRECALSQGPLYPKNGHRRLDPLLPKSATERTRFRGRGWRRGRAITSAAVTL